MMRNTLRGFYSDDLNIADALLAENAIIIFDTSVLINLYAFNDNSQKAFFEILEAAGDRIWLPFHVTLEYQRNRVPAIARQKKQFREADKELDKIIEQFETLQGSSLFKRVPALVGEADRCRKQLSRCIDDFKKELEKQNKLQPEVRSNDSIRERINQIFDGKVGNPPAEQKEINEIQKEGAERFKYKVPPGYCDAKKENGAETHFSYSGITYEHQYGDLIAWKQCIAKVATEMGAHVVFVTDDEKEDWLYQIDSNGKKKLGVRAELREEMFSEGKVESFHLLNSSDFIQIAASAYGVDIQDDTVADVRERVMWHSEQQEEARDAALVEWEQFESGEHDALSELLAREDEKKLVSIVKNMPDDRKAEMMKDMFQLTAASDEKYDAGKAFGQVMLTGFAGLLLKEMFSKK